MFTLETLSSAPSDSWEGIIRGYFTPRENPLKHHWVHEFLRIRGSPTVLQSMNFFTKILWCTGWSQQLRMSRGNTYTQKIKLWIIPWVRRPFRVLRDFCTQISRGLSARICVVYYYSHIYSMCLLLPPFHGKFVSQSQGSSYGLATKAAAISRVNCFYNTVRFKRARESITFGYHTHYNLISSTNSGLPQPASQYFWFRRLLEGTPRPTPISSHVPITRSKSQLWLVFTRPGYPLF